MVGGGNPKSTWGLDLNKERNSFLSHTNGFKILPYGGLSWYLWGGVSKATA